MTHSSLAEGDFGAHDAAASDSFLATHRALGACAREIERLCDEVVRGVAALHVAGLEQKPSVRQSPGRCIVQLGPVALTVTWLRNTLDSVASGELLVIVWRGSVAPRSEHHPEWPAERNQQAAAATALWEEVFSATGSSESSWRWQSSGKPRREYSSTQLAARCVEKLKGAHAQA